MWKKVLILVEGQTEEQFIKNILKPYFESMEIDIEPKIIVTKENLKGKNYKGGVGKYESISKDLVRLLNDSSAVLVTTMFDYYGFPRDIPGYDKDMECRGNCYNKAEQLESLIVEEVKRTLGYKKAEKLLPFITLHEFEAFLFVSPDKTVSDFSCSNEKLKRKLKGKLNSIKSNYQSPEEINDGENTHPAKRLKTVIPEYQKLANGISALMEVELDEIRNQCPHFDKWIKKLESIKDD